MCSVTLINLYQNTGYMAPWFDYKQISVAPSIDRMILHDLLSPSESVGPSHGGRRTPAESQYQPQTCK